MLHRDKHQNIQLGKKEIKRKGSGWLQRLGKKKKGSPAIRNSQANLTAK
jgi:hypothetical protein